MSVGTPSPLPEMLARLDAVRDGLRTATGVPPAVGLTAPDPPTGERWEEGQVWAHLAEFIPYWIGEARRVIGGGGSTVPFGRTKKDPARIAAIERERATDRAALWQRVEGDIASLRDFLERLPDGAWTASGVHPTLGEMGLERIVDEFLVGHLEEHRHQLEGLRG